MPVVASIEDGEVFGDVEGKPLVRWEGPGVKVDSIGER